MTRALPATHAVVCLPSLDLRATADHGAELGSQLLMGEVVRLLSATRDRGWFRLRNEADGYEGWARDWGLVPASAARAARWLARATGQIEVQGGFVRSAPGGGIGVSPLCYGCRVIAGPRRGKFRRVELPDARRGWIEARAIRARGVPALEDRILDLLGAPYLWGGRTPAGYDCSGFVQQLLLEQGVPLPRDAHQQWKACRPLGKHESPKPGDLAFFSRPGEPMSHVGLALGSALYAHSRGRVQIAALDKANALYDKVLAGQFRGWFRPRSAA